MAKHKRTPMQREDDLRQIVTLYLQGHTQVQIGEMLGLSNQQISYDLATVRKRWQQQTVYNLDEHKARELARLDTVERAAWRGWDRSQRPGVKKNWHVTGDPEVATWKAIEMTRRDGDPRYLTIVMDCVHERCKILGLYAPTRYQVSLPDGPTAPALPTRPLDLDKLSPERRRLLLELMEEAAPTA